MPEVVIEPSSRHTGRRFEGKGMRRAPVRRRCVEEGERGAQALGEGAWNGQHAEHGVCFLDPVGPAELEGAGVQRRSALDPRVNVYGP